jgi:hypothetical protein
MRNSGTGSRGRMPRWRRSIEGAARRRGRSLGPSAVPGHRACPGWRVRAWRGHPHARPAGFAIHAEYTGLGWSLAGQRVRRQGRDPPRSDRSRSETRLPQDSRRSDTGGSHPHSCKPNVHAVRSSDAPSTSVESEDTRRNREGGLGCLEKPSSMRSVEKPADEGSSRHRFLAWVIRHPAWSYDGVSRLLK